MTDDNLELEPIPTPPGQDIGENERPPAEGGVAPPAPNEDAGYEENGPPPQPEPPPLVADDFADVVRGPYTTNPDGTIDCEVNHPKYGWIAFTASPDDVEEHGRLVYEYAASQM